MSTTNSVWMSILQNRAPSTPSTLPPDTLDLSDVLEDRVFSKWLFRAVQDQSILVNEPDMLFGTAMQLMLLHWSAQTEDYALCCRLYAPLITRLATLGIAIDYVPEEAN